MACNQLSKILKNNYGAKKLVEGLIDSGKIKMVPWIAGAFVAGVAVTIGTQKAIKHFSKEKEIIELEMSSEEELQDISKEDEVKEIIEEVPVN